MVAEGMFATGAVDSYCTSEDVMVLVEAYELDESASELTERIRGLLGHTRRAMEMAAGRDFRHHEDETVLLDGTDSRTVTLGSAGVHPPVSVEAVQVDGAEVDAADWRYYPLGNSIRLVRDARMQRFPEGVQNVEVSLSWGYEEPPGDIVLAQAKLTAAEVLGELGGDAEAVKAMRLGDYSVKYAEGGRYGAEIRRLVDEAERIARRYRGVRVLGV